MDIIDDATSDVITTLTNNDPENVTFQSDLTEGDYFGNVIFTVTDTSNNTNNDTLAYFTVDLRTPRITETDSVPVTGDEPHTNFFDVTFAN